MSWAGHRILRNTVPGSKKPRDKIHFVTRSGNDHSKYVQTGDDAKIGKKLFIADGALGLTIVPVKNEETVADLTAEKGALTLTVLDEKKFKVTGFPANVLGHDVIAVKRSGKKVRLSFKE